jgi:hypothetical protein
LKVLPKSHGKRNSIIPRLIEWKSEPPHSTKKPWNKEFLLFFTWIHSACVGHQEVPSVSCVRRFPLF